MTFKKIAALAAGIGLLMACEDGNKPATGDTGTDTAVPSGPTPAGPPFISQVTAGCLETTDGIFVEFMTDNLAYDPIIHIFDTQNDGAAAGSVWDEEHVLDANTHAIDNDPDGAWDLWGMDLTAVGNPANVNPGSTTLFGCSYHNEDALTYAIEVWDATSNAVADCAVFGGDPGAIIAGDWPQGADAASGFDPGNQFQNCRTMSPI